MFSQIYYKPGKNFCQSMKSGDLYFNIGGIFEGIHALKKM